MVRMRKRSEKGKHLLRQPSEQDQERVDQKMTHCLFCDAGVDTVPESRNAPFRSWVEEFQVILHSLMWLWLRWWTDDWSSWRTGELGGCGEFVDWKKGVLDHCMELLVSVSLLSKVEVVW